ncbi:hypothetical protein EB809_10710 [Marinobacter sp. R17]|uniref:hypothetical protein n=1 Tax=Marinobacter sp. R17 TaxID=2484250 RepID=UPI000F4CFADF|nr:hypothetical protein [Marinobacter sp. R17]ROT99717.1 hypothetical protein EB809_10710 [Marinobacter sp. R17]
MGIVLIPAIMALAGCKTEKSPDNPTVLGTPAKTAYLGVEYYYNFGAYGGDAILDYSLTNAPPWLAMEDTSNKAREGIIIRGVPGVTGGNRGEADLGTTNDINLTATDGSRVGVQPFDIEVKQNLVTASAENFTEGERSDDVDGAGEGETCAMPPMKGTGLHQITYDTFNTDGTVSGSESATLKTYPVIVRVLLDQPSVQTTKIAFELQSDYDPTACDDGATSGQDCEFSLRNREEAQLGKDVVLAGNQNNSGGEERLPQPDYIEVIDDTSGVLTIDRGITECFIRLEVVDDQFAEPTEQFEIALTEVRQGLVALGGDNDGVSESLSIADNQPAVTFQSLKGHSVSAINEGDTQNFQAVLDRKQEPDDTVYKVRLINDSDNATATDPDYEFLVPDDVGSTTYVAGNELTFSQGVDTVEFQVRAIDDSSAPPASENPTGDGPDNNDEYVSVSVDSDYQDGRPNYAASESDLKVWLNELDSPLEVGDESAGKTPSDVVVGDNGRMFVASALKDSGDGHYDVVVDIYNRFGGAPEKTFTLSAESGVDPQPRLTFLRTTIEAGTESRVRNALALTFATDGAISGASNRGGKDEAVYLFRRDAGDAAYSELWHGQFGSGGDDTPLRIGINASNRVFIAGETTGTWSGETRAGGKDVYAQRIDTETEDAVQSPVIAWTSQQGSSSDDTLAGLGVSSSTAYLAGTTLGQIGDETPLGGRDLFTSSYSGGTESSPSIVQVGTSSNDTLNTAVVASSSYWMLGDGNFGYRRDINTDEYVAELVTDASDASKQGYLLSYDLSGNFRTAISLNDPDDVASDSFTALTAFDGDMIVGGHSDAAFVEGKGAGMILARVRSEDEVVEEPAEDEEDDPIEHEFTKLVEDDREQYPSLGSNARLIKLAAYEDAEIVALVASGSSGSRVYHLVLLNGDGQLLNTP